MSNSRMAMLFCDRCDRDFINFNEHFRHQIVCERHSTFKRRQKTKSNEREFFFDNDDQHEIINVETFDEKFIREKKNQIDQSIQFFENNNDNENDLYIQKKFVILSINFFVKIQIYEKMIRKKTNSFVHVELKKFFSQKKNVFVKFKFHFFNDEIDYVFVF